MGVVMEVEWAATDEVADRIRNEWSNERDLVFYLNTHIQANEWFKELMKRFKLDELDAMALAVMADIGDVATMRSTRDALLARCTQDYRGFHDKEGVPVTYASTLQLCWKHPLPEVVVSITHGKKWCTIRTLTCKKRQVLLEEQDELKHRCLESAQPQMISEYQIALLKSTLVALNWAQPSENFDEKTLTVDLGWVHPDVEKRERQEEKIVKQIVQRIGDFTDYLQKDKTWELGDSTLVDEHEDYDEYLLTGHPGVPKPGKEARGKELYPEFRPGLNYVDIVRVIPRGKDNRSLHHVDVLEIDWLRRKDKKTKKVFFNEDHLVKQAGAYRDISAATWAAAAHGCPVHLYHRVDDKDRYQTKQRFDKDGNGAIQKSFRKVDGKYQYLSSKPRRPGTYHMQRCWKEHCPDKGKDTLHRLEHSRDVCLACTKQSGVPIGEDRVICELFVPMNWLSHLFTRDPGSDMYLRVRIYGDYVEHLMKYGYAVVNRVKRHGDDGKLLAEPYKIHAARWQCSSTFRRRFNYDGSTPLMVPDPWNKDFLDSQLESGKRLTDVEVYLKSGRVHINTSYGEWVHDHYFECERIRSEPYYLLHYEPDGAFDAGIGEFGPSPDYAPGRLLRHEKPSGAVYDYTEKYSSKAEYFVSSVRTAIRTGKLTLNQVDESTHWVRMSKAPVPTTSWTLRCPWGE